MSLSRKHYRGLAAMIKDAVENKSSVDEVARNLADFLKEDNSGFRYDTFYKACGLDMYGEVPKHGPMRMTGGQR
jgi:hypothetical protein